MYYVWDNFLEDVFDYRGGGGIWLRAPEEEDRFYLTAEVYTDSPNGRFSTTIVNGIFPVEPFAKFASRWDLLPGRVVIPGSAGVPPAQDLAGSWRLASQGWSVHPLTDAGAAP